MKMANKSKCDQYCQCPKVSRFILFLSEREKAYMKEIMEGMITTQMTVLRMAKDAINYGLVKTDWSMVNKGAPRKYYSLTDRGKKQAALVRACNEHLLKKN